MFLENVSNHIEIINLLEKINLGENQTISISIGENSSVDIPLLIDCLNNKSYNFFGGIFPAVIGKGKSTDSGCVIKVFNTSISPHLIKEINRYNITTDKINSLPVLEKGINTAMVFIDGLSSSLAFFLDKLYTKYGTKINYLGGGAGSLTLRQRPCVFNHEGIFENAAIVAFIDHKIMLGVNHGWEKIAGPFISTSSNQNIIHELNWEDAFTAYKRFVEEDSGTRLTKENFFSIAKSYPFGLQKQHREYVVRDPISVHEDSSLFCVGEVHEHSVLDILKGDPDKLIEAATNAAQKSCEIDAPYQDHFLIDCISRVLFLEDKFNKEIENIDKIISKINPNHQSQGVLSLGEIASNGDGFLEFYNKTIVSGIFY